jgi:predicted transposase/invertase (TIGR01784 family)
VWYNVIIKESGFKIMEKKNAKHDKGYKRVFSRNRNFLHFLEKYIRHEELADWINGIDKNNLFPMNAELIDKEFQKRESDIIYRMKFKNREIIFYVLLELQSTVDYSMPFRLMRYMTLILNHVFENTPKNERESKDYRLPAIVPIVLYNGADNWTAVKTFKEYLQDYDQFGKYIIDFEYYLLDLKRMEDETILTTKQIVDIIFLLDKRSNKEAIDGELLKRAMEYYNNLSAEDKNDMLDWLNHIWLSHITNQKQKDELLKNFEKGDIESMNSGLSIAFDRERQKGREEGAVEAKKKAEKKAHKEKIESVKNLIEVGLTDSQISKAMKIEISEIERIRQKE